MRGEEGSIVGAVRWMGGVGGVVAAVSLVLRSRHRGSLSPLHSHHRAPMTPHCSQQYHTEA